MKDASICGSGEAEEAMFSNQYRDVDCSQLKLEPSLYKHNSMDTNKKLANSASEEFEKLYKVREETLPSVPADNRINLGRTCAGKGRFWNCLRGDTKQRWIESGD